MYFRVQHTTTYSYSQPVNLSPHVIRLKPRISDRVLLSKYALKIYPDPVSIHESFDAEGNLVHLAWFGAPAKKLVILSSFEARARAVNPYNFIITEPTALHLPATYGRQAEYLAHYRMPRRQSGPVAKIANRIQESVRGDTMLFLQSALAFFADFKHVIRDTGGPMMPEKLLEEKKGACRDFAVLFMELCRHAGLASRFVSGYWKGLRPSEKRYLHAWVEVYLPGAGWVGFDPTSGLAVTDGHIPVCASGNPADAAPVDGAFSGEAKARMEWSIKIEARSTQGI